MEIRDGSDVLLDTSQIENGESPVLEVPVGMLAEDVDRTPVSSSFAEYYYERLKGMIEYLKMRGELDD